MKKVKEWLLASNHGKHIIWMFVLTLLNLLLLNALDVNVLTCFVGSFYTSAAVGVAMEWKDKRWGGVFDYQDFMYDMYGTVIAIFVFIFLIGF